MSTPTAKVADIFTTAGEAFTRLGQLAVQLNPSDGDGTTQASKWGPEEIDMLRTAVQRFGEDMKKISEHIKTRSVAQIKSALKQKIHEDGGIVSPPTTPKKRPSTQKKPSNVNQEQAVKKLKIDTSGSDSSSQLTSDPMMPQVGQLRTPQSQSEPESIVDIENIFDQGEQHTVLSQHEMDPSLRTQMTVSDLLSESVNIL